MLLELAREAVPVAEKAGMFVAGVVPLERRRTS